MAKKPTLTPEEARQEALKTALETIERKFGQGAVMKLSDDVHVKVPVIPTGSIGVDLALGIGGIPKGQVTEIYGPESSGKTTLTLHVIAECQKLGGTAAFIDAEHALDVTYAGAWRQNPTNCSSRSPTTESRPLKSPTCWSVPARWTSWSSTPWPPLSPRPNSKARWAKRRSAARPPDVPRAPAS